MQRWQGLQNKSGQEEGTQPHTSVEHTSCDRTTKHPVSSSSPNTKKKATHLALRSMAVETRLGGPVATTFAVVHVDREVEVEEVALHNVRRCRLGKHRQVQRPGVLVGVQRT